MTRDSLSFISSRPRLRCCEVGMVKLFLPCLCLSDFALAVSRSNHLVPVPIFRFRQLLAQYVFKYSHGTF